jgi:capsular exopolysaccharide synthesis family protein
MDLDTASPPTASDPRWLLTVAWRRKGLILLGAVLGLALGLGYAAVWTPLYQSNAQVLVVRKQSDGLAGSAAPLDDPLPTQQGLLKSPLVLQRAAKQHQLAALRSFANEKEDVTTVLMKNLSVTRGKDPAGMVSNILTLSYRGPSPDECSQILDAVLAAYEEVLAETYLHAGDNTVELITRARNVLQEELTQKEAAYIKFRQEGPLLAKGKDGATPPQERVNSIEGRRTDVLLQRSELKGRLTTLETGLKEGLGKDVLLALVADFARRPVGVQVLPESTRPQEELTALQQQEQDLLERFGPNHVEVRAVRKRIEVARAALGMAAPPTPGSPDAGRPDPVRWYLENLKQQIAHLDAANDALTKLSAQEYDEARKLSGYEVQDETMRNDIARTQQLYETIIKQLKQADLARDLGGFDSRVIAPPGTGGVKKVEPSTAVLVALTALLCLLGATGLAAGAEVLDRGYRSLQEIRRQFGVPVLGQVPLVPRAGGRAAKAPNLHPLLGAFHRPDSAEAEAYREVRAALAFGAGAKGRQVIQVTSPRPHDGATTLAANLAVSLAQAGKRVALVDANLRDARVHELFGLTPGVGLGSFLQGQGDCPDVVVESGLDHLALVPAGPVASPPGELLQSPRFAELLGWLRRQNDFVLVDTPALLSAADARVVAGQVDGLLLNLRPEGAARASAERAHELLGSVPAALLGVVVTTGRGGLR